jgi:peptidyl-prolyl cis-trans isomerase D
MALMTQIRNNLAKAFAVFAALFIVYIVLDWGMDLPQMRPGFTGDVVGVVNGNKLTYREFSEMLRREIENYRAQSGAEPDDDTERYLRDQVWNAFVQQTLIEEEIDRLGIEVADKEIIDIVHGPDPPEFLVQNFRDSLGNFNRSAYDQAIADPQNRSAWVQVEQALRQQRKQEKLQSLLYAAVHVTPSELKQRYLDQNTSIEAEYVLFEPGRFYPDSVVAVSDEEIRRHYNANQNEFLVRPSRKIKYVFISINPSREDTLDVMNEMEHILGQVGAGMDFMELASTYSEVPTTPAYFKHGELSRPKETAVFSAKKGEIVGPISDYDGFHLIKVLNERRGSAEYVRASHILVNYVAGEDSLPKIEKARDLLRQIREGADFAALAKAHSDDVGSAQEGGELGWNGRGVWVKPFEDAAFRARVGDVVGPVRSQFGWHIIKVTGRDARELELASLTMRLKTSARTIDMAYKQAEDFSHLAKSEGFEKAAEFSRYEVRDTPDFNKGGTIPGIGFNESIMNFAFREKVGTVSDPISVRGGIVVVKVADAREEGVQPLDDVKGIVRSMVLREKKLGMLRAEVEAFHKQLQPGADLVAAAQGLPNVSAQKTGPFKVTESVPTVGRDPAFAGTASALAPGEISKPFEGQRGFYILKVVAKTDFDEASFSRQRESLYQQMLQEKRNRLLTQWTTALRERAEIEDNRDKFFR